MSANINDFNHLKELGKSNYEIATGESDIRGWTVKNEHGVILGEVYDLLLNTEVRRIAYIILNLDGNELHLEERKVLLPIEYAEVNETQKNVIYPGIMANELTSLPTYEKEKINRNAIDHINQVFSSTSRGNISHTNPLGYTETADLNRDTRIPSTYPKQESLKDSMMHDEKSISEYIVIGVFDHITQGPVASDSLMKNGFSKRDITILNKTDVESGGRSETNKKSVMDYFLSILGNEEEKASFYSESALSGSVVTIHTPTLDLAEKAAGILDKLGAVDIDIVVRTKQSDHVTVVSRSRYKSKNYKA